jgi:hypothetical protein
LVIKFFNLKRSSLFPYWKYFLCFLQTKVIHWLYSFLIKINFCREKTIGFLGKRTKGPFFWEEKEIERILNNLGFSVSKKILARKKVFPHPVFICVKNK